MSKTVLITGGGRGIGRACALLFAQNGFDVAINYCKNKTAAEDTAREVERLGARATLFCADISDSTAVAKMIKQVYGTMGKIDVLVNNAGISKTQIFIDSKDEDIEDIIATNLKGTIYCTREVLKNMLSCQSGAIINISSVWGQTGGSCEVLYSATKAAIIGFSKALAKEVGLSGVRVNCVCPGVIETDMIAGLSSKDKEDLKDNTPLNRLGKAEDIAKAVLYLAKEEDSSFVTGQVLGVNGGFYI